MEDNKNIDGDGILSKKHLLEKVVFLVFNKMLGEESFPNISKTTIEGIMVGIARNINCLEELNKDILQGMYNDLRNDHLYSLESLKEGLSHKDKVLARLNRAVEIFSNEQP